MKSSNISTPNHSFVYLESDGHLYALNQAHLEGIFNLEKIQPAPGTSDTSLGMTIYRDQAYTLLQTQQLEPALETIKETKTVDTNRIGLVIKHKALHPLILVGSRAKIQTTQHEGDWQLLTIPDEFCNQLNSSPVEIIYKIA